MKQSSETKEAALLVEDSAVNASAKIDPHPTSKKLVTEDSANAMASPGKLPLPPSRVAEEQEVSRSSIKQTPSQLEKQPSMQRISEGVEHPIHTDKQHQISHAGC